MSYQRPLQVAFKMEENLEMEPTSSPRPESSSGNVREDEIDLVDLSKAVWSKRVFIAKMCFVGFLMGALIAFTSKVEFEAYCKLLPENQEAGKGNLGGLGSLAGLAGINLDMTGSGSLSPMIYPEIVRSMPFQLSLINTPIKFELLDSTLTSYEYLKNIDSPSLMGLLVEYTIGLPGKVKSFLKKEDTAVKGEGSFIKLSKEDFELIDNFRDRINITVSDETGIVTIRTEFPDPIASAALTDHIVRKLTSRVTAYKIEKATVNLNFIQERYLETEKRYQESQSRVARFTDENRNISSSVMQTEYERLQNDLNIAFEVYKGLATQLEQAKIQVKEETPVFTVLEPVRIPEDKFKPKRLLIMFGFVFAAIFFTSTGIVVMYVIEKRKNL